MSIAIQWGYDNTQEGELGFVYLDSVQTFKKSFSGTVSKNPIDGGGNISDHFTRDNPIINISAIISGVDISLGLLGIEDENGYSPTNIRNSFPSAQVNSDDKSLVKLLPSSIGQFFTPQKPKISMAAQPVDIIQKVKESLESLFNRNVIQLIKLYEYSGTNLTTKPTINLVLTNFTATEDTTSGTGLNCEFTLEQITFGSYKKTVIPKNIRLANAEGLAEKGKVDSTPIDPSSPTATGPLATGYKVMNGPPESALYKISDTAKKAIGASIKAAAGED